MVLIPGVLGLSQDFDHDKIWASIYIATSKAIFAFAIGYGIIGVTNGVGGKLCSLIKLCRISFLLFLRNLQEDFGVAATICSRKIILQCILGTYSFDTYENSHDEISVVSKRILFRKLS